MIKYFIPLTALFLSLNAQQLPTNPPCGLQIRIATSEGIQDGEDKIVICDQCGRKAKVVIIACGEYCKFCEFHDPKGK